jgi:GWxTD domain-containing protein
MVLNGRTEFNLLMDMKMSGVSKMKAIKPYLVTLFLISGALFFFAQANSQTELSSGIPPQPRNFYLGMDYACFEDLADTSNDYVELYYSFNRKELEFVPEDSGAAAKILMQLDIKDEQGNEVVNRMWTTGTQASNVDEAKKTDYLIIDAIGTNLKPGTYQVALQARDVNSMASGEARLKMDARSFSSDRLQISDLELSFNLVDDTTGGRLTKAGKKILPNPSRIFTREKNVLYFYAELYHLSYGPGIKPEYTLDFSIQDVSGKTIKEFAEQTQTKPGNSAVVISGLNLSTLERGEYLLEVEAKDKHSGQRASAIKKFMVFKEKTADELMADEVKRFKQDVIYIATPSELNVFDQLNPAGKQKYIADFWKRRDPDPETPGNEFKTEHYRRIEYANFHFSRTSDSDDGWNTDMGRVYIRYGEPSEIERHPSTRGEKPWEKWNYNELKGGVYFIFVDEDGYGVYRLVHSTMTGEIRDDSWENKIKNQESYDN